MKGRAPTGLDDGICTYRYPGDKQISVAGQTQRSAILKFFGYFILPCRPVLLTGWQVGTLILACRR